MAATQIFRLTLCTPGSGPDRVSIGVSKIHRAVYTYGCYFVPKHDGVWSSTSVELPHEVHLPQFKRKRKDSGKIFFKGDKLRPIAVA